MCDIPEHDPETPSQAEPVGTSAEPVSTESASAEPVNEAQPAAPTGKLFGSGFTQEELDSMLGTTDSAALTVLGLC
jgi:hypothetical protein